ncbi:hypothetical protein [Actinocatenispora rupis]|uniref:YrhK-like protein n=1 Tax=Actinocatenispora rupis TaxID=519421 RepID=A0A8J3JH90_9ACTN|nr:hypothetical protein [Actinocatenispora rupis]GID16362.1 hypothetical protein Aru02nite_72510 [Actinocatenispora rupis]
MPRPRRSAGAPATFVDHVRADGAVVRLGSRFHRKHQAPAGGSTWWAPRARGWWIAVLFAVGSLLFALGSIPWYASATGARADTVTYFVGSLFFTAASFLSYREAVDAGTPARRRFFTVQPRRIDWWATAIQLVGTLYFNVSTGVAVVQDLSASAAHQHVWRPDAIGSICFLVSSLLAWYESCHGWIAWRPRSWGWWITLVNLLGSVAFGVSAVAGYINPVTGQVRDLARADAQTFVGAVCFLVGAVLLLPERTEASRGGIPRHVTDPGSDPPTGTPTPPP